MRKKSKKSNGGDKNDSLTAKATGMSGGESQAGKTSAAEKIPGGGGRKKGGPAEGEGKAPVADARERAKTGAGRLGRSGLPVLTGEQLERLLEVNRRTVQRYVKERGLPKLARDRYDLKAVWAWQSAQLTEELARKNMNADRLLKAQADEREHKAALLKSKRELMDGRLVERQTVELDRLDRAWAVRKQLERLSDELAEGLTRIGRAGVPAAGTRKMAAGTRKAAAHRAGEWEVEIRETVEAAVLRCREAWAKEPGEFDELERLLAQRLAERITAAISAEERQAADQAEIVRILNEECPALVIAGKPK